MLPSGDGTVTADSTGQKEKKEAELNSTLSKGQITALAALSIGDIDLLRQHLDRDDKTRFYELILALIIICLTLQIMSGLITIMVAQLKSYYQKHHVTKTPSHMCIMCCGCKPSPDSPVFKWDRFCNCFTCRTGEEYEYTAMDEYETWCNTAIQIERECHEAKEGLECQNNIIQNCQETLDMYQKQLDAEVLEKDDFVAKTTPVNQQKEAAMTRKHYYLQQEAHAATFLKDGELLYNRVDDIHKNRTMEKATFFTHTTNYLLFTVTILHGLILGLGVFTMKKVEEST